MGLENCKNSVSSLEANFMSKAETEVCLIPSFLFRNDKNNLLQLSFYIYLLYIWHAFFVVWVQQTKRDQIRYM